MGQTSNSKFPSERKAIAPRKKHLFGPDRPSPGKPKGVVAKITRNLKEGIINGAVAHGLDGEGKGGLDGYLRMCATKYPKHYMQLLGKLLPHVIKGDAVAGQTIGTVNVMSVPAGNYLSRETIARLQSQSLQLEHATQTEPTDQDRFQTGTPTSAPSADTNGFRHEPEIESYDDDDDEDNSGVYISRRRRR